MDVIEQVKHVLKDSKTPYRGIDLTAVPTSVLLEFLLFRKPDTSQDLKKKSIPNLVHYGLISHANLKDVDRKYPLGSVTVGINSKKPSSPHQKSTVKRVVKTVTASPKPCGNCPSSVV